MRKIEKINEVLLTSNLRSDKYWYGKGEFPSIKIEQPKFGCFKIQYTILYYSNEFHDNNDIDENILIYHAE